MIPTAPYSAHLNVGIRNAIEGYPLRRQSGKMAQLARNTQTTVCLSDREITVGTEVYPIADVLYAEVVDKNDRPLRGFFRFSDLLLGFWICLFILAFAALFVLAINLPALNLVGFTSRGIAMLVLPLGFLASLAVRSTNKWRAKSPVTLRIYTRNRTIEALRTTNLLRCHMLARQIDRLVKRRAVG